MNPSDEQAFAYYNLGLCYMEKENYSMAETNFNKAKTIYETIKIPDAIELLNLQKGIVYKAKGKTELATQIFNRIIATPDDPYRIKAEALYQMGIIEAAQNRSNLAINYLRRAIEVNAATRNYDQKAKIVKAMSGLYENMSDMKNAYLFLKRHN